MAHELPPLPYDYDALEPHIDARTMEIHHSKHHNAYVAGLNGALEGHDDLADMSVEALLADINLLPDLVVESEYPIELIYAREGLPEPSHTIEKPLEPRTNYHWTVRARFELDGHPRVISWGRWQTPRGGVTDWDRLTPHRSSYKSLNSWRQALVPNPFYYRFKTPRK